MGSLYSILFQHVYAHWCVRSQRKPGGEEVKYRLQNNIVYRMQHSYQRPRLVFILKLGNKWCDVDSWNHHRIKPQTADAFHFLPLLPILTISRVGSPYDLFPLLYFSGIIFTGRDVSRHTAHAECLGTTNRRLWSTMGAYVILTDSSIS